MTRDLTPFLTRQTNAKFIQALNQLNLSTDELHEVSGVKKKLASGDTHGFSHYAYTTNNAGVQYLMLDDSTLISSVLDNENLHRDVAVLFLDRLKFHKSIKLNRDICFSIDNLMTRSFIVADVNLFKRVWHIVEEINPHEGLHDFEEEGGAYSSILYNSLVFNSAPQQGKSEMSIETLMLILNYLSKKDEAVLSISLKNLSDTIAASRAGEIEAWIAVNMPDYSGLPLSWVFKIFDLYPTE